MMERCRSISRKTKAFVLLTSALLGALLITFLSDNLSFEEKLIQSGLKNAFSSNEVREFQNEDLELQALLLDYSETPELVLKTRIAIDKYGDEARNVLAEYGSEPEFKEILSEFGVGVIPVIHFFITNDITSVRITQSAQESIHRVGNGVKEKAKRTWEWFWSEPEVSTQQDVPSEGVEEDIDPVKHGWYAVNKIHKYGYDFLGQFEIGSDNNVSWIQTERVTEGISFFFTSGVRDLETKHAMGQDINSSDVLWAGVDAAFFISAVKALRAVKLARYGKVARSGEVVGSSSKRLSLLNRTKSFAGKIVPKNAFGRTILKGGSRVALLYIVAKHPGILNSIFAEFAEFLGLNPLLVQILGWTVLLFGMYLLFSPILRISLPLLRRVISMLTYLINQAERLFAKRAVE